MTDNKHEEIAGRSDLARVIADAEAAERKLRHELMGDYVSEGRLDHIRALIAAARGQKKECRELREMLKNAQLEADTIHKRFHEIYAMEPGELRRRVEEADHDHNW